LAAGPVDLPSGEFPFMTQPPKLTSFGDRRVAPRIEIEGSVEVRILTAELTGTCQNVSADGMLLLSNESIPVEVIVSRVHPPARGRLVRVQPLDGTTSGMAIKFDADDPLGQL
jgi:hypothetical protein